jgi:lipopolysaccharide/colanic/teichoic acid biosynthesis glycosyltransferase
MTKRLFDVTVSIAGLIIMSPVVLVTAVLILMDSGGPIFYSAIRTGKHEKKFRILKFRSMRAVVDGAHSHHSGDDDPRITRVGNVIRKYKIDELPQLLNVIRGSMSLVGPRPETPEYTKLYTEEQKVIFAVRPGITDYASIEFADLGDILAGGDPDRIYFEKVWDRKMELRLKYVDEHTFWGDIRLIIATIALPFSRRRGET